jgi:cation diffusion facilitator family transporter
MHDEHPGPHDHEASRVIHTDRGRVVLSIFEEGVPPRFRLDFPDATGTPPPATAFSLETFRSDGSRETFVFETGDGFLEAAPTVGEPHEFEATLTIRGGDQLESYDLRFVEHDHQHEPVGGLKGAVLGALHLTHGSGGHSHAGPDEALLSNQRGVWALKWSFVGLGVTALIQAGVVALSGSAGLLADTIHNFADAGTAIPLWIAFTLQRRAASQRFTYGLDRTEDLAGLIIVAIVFASALLAGYSSIERLITQQAPTHIPLAMAAAVVGFLGNELVAQFRLRVGREIESAALIADGLHARTDGFTSLAALVGLVGAWVGYPVFDGIAGLLITAVILMIVIRDAAPSVFTRLLDGIEPATVQKLRSVAADVNGVEEVNWIRARWTGHRVDVEANVRIGPGLTIERAHAVAHEVEHQLGHALDHPGHLVVVTSTHRENAPEGYVHTHRHVVAD